MNSSALLAVFVACLAGQALSFPANNNLQSLSINSPLSGQHLNPYGSYANTGYGYQQGAGYNLGFANPYFAPHFGNSHESSASGVNHFGSAFDTYHSSNPFGYHTGSSSYNPIFGTKSFNKVSKVPGASIKVSSHKNPFQSHYEAHQTVGLPGLPGSYTVSTKTTATKNPVIFPVYGQYANFGGYGDFGYGHGYGHPQVSAGALLYGLNQFGPARQLRQISGRTGHHSAYATMGKLRGY